METIEERAREYANQYRRYVHDLKGERAVEKKQNEYKLIGRLTKVPGHTLYKFNATTREVSKAKMRTEITRQYDPDTDTVIRHVKSDVKVEKDCYYEQALNMKNFIKRLRRRGIIGADENVKIVK